MGAALEELPPASTGTLPVEIGDLLLVRTPRASYGLGRRLARASYDHVGVVAAGAKVVNIVRPKVVLTPLERMLEPARAARVLRPAFPSSADRDAFAEEQARLRGAPYDVGRTIGLLPRILLLRWFGVVLRHRPPRQDRLICSDTVMAGLLRHVPRFEDVRGLPLDWSALGCGTADDLLIVARARPDLLRDLGSPRPHQ